MPRKKKEPEPIIRVFHCWLCNEYHEFKRSFQHMSKLKKQYLLFTNQLYGWRGEGQCNAYLEDFDPEEELVRSKGRGAR